MEQSNIPVPAAFSNILDNASGALVVEAVAFESSNAQPMADTIVLGHTGHNYLRTVTGPRLVDILTEISLVMIAQDYCFTTRNMEKAQSGIRRYSHSFGFGPWSASSSSSPAEKIRKAMNDLVPRYVKSCGLTRTQITEWIEIIKIMYGEETINGTVQCPPNADELFLYQLQQQAPLFGAKVFNAVPSPLLEIPPPVNIAKLCAKVANEFYRRYPEARYMSPGTHKGLYIPVLLYAFYIIFYPIARETFLRVLPDEASDRITLLNDIVCMNWLHVKNVDLPMKHRRLDASCRQFLYRLTMAWLRYENSERERIIVLLNEPPTEELLR